MNWINLYEIIDYSPSEFLEFIKPRIHIIQKHNIALEYSAYNLFSKYLKINVNYARNVGIRKRGRMLFDSIVSNLTANTIIIHFQYKYKELERLKNLETYYTMITRRTLDDNR